MPETCPACRRPLKTILDYPLVLVRTVERPPIPEWIDYWSGEALRARAAWSHLPGPEEFGAEIPPSGLNRTPELAAACESAVVQHYLRSLESYQGQVIPPTALLPPLKPDRYFTRAYPLPGSRLFVALDEAEPGGGARMCEVVFYAQGPNLGSAGGPTLQKVGAIATIRYEGRLVGLEPHHR